MTRPSREDAEALLREYTSNDNLIKHALGVEAAMRHYARHFDEDEELWGIVGLIHDFDYDRHPTLEEHPFVGAEILRERGWPEEIVHAVLSHADHTGVPRENRMEKTLYAVDELVGFIVAVVLVRPGRNLHELPVASVTKKFKDKAFCRAVDRDHLHQGAEDLGVPMDEHVAHVIAGMREVADELGLAGEGGGDGA